MTLDQIISIVSDSKKKYGIEGVTYLGGEPTLQIGLPELSEAIKSLELGIIAFTGEEYESVKESLIFCDTVIDGPYMESLASCKRRIIGSDNQKIIHLTDRYRHLEWWFFKSTQIMGDFNSTDQGILYNGNIF